MAKFKTGDIVKHTANSMSSPVMTVVDESPHTPGEMVCRYWNAAVGKFTLCYITAQELKLHRS